MNRKLAELGSDSKRITNSADWLTGFVREFKNHQTQAVAERKQFLRATFGETNRSTLAWALPIDSAGGYAELLNRLHAAFWSTEPIGTIAGTDASGKTTLADESETGLELVELALCAYGVAGDWEVRRNFDQATLLTNPLQSQLRHVEMPIWKATTDTQAEEPLAMLVDRMEKLIGECLDGDGWPEACVVADIGLLAASWCRCCVLLEHLSHEIEPQVHFMLVGLLQQLFRLSRKDGSLLLGTDGGGGVNCNSFRKCLLKSWSDTIGAVPEGGYGAVAKSQGSAASSISEWGQVGVLQKKWRVGGNKVAFAFGDRRVQLEISNGRTLVWGDSTPELSIDGTPDKVASEIGVSGFLRFDGGDYIELELEYERATVQRQIVFLSRDDLLLVNDVVVVKEVAAIDYGSSLQIGRDFGLVRESENNEFYLKRGDNYHLVLPMAMPEWKTEPSAASVEFEEQSFAMRMRADRALGLACPIVFDLKAKRSLKPRTWRRLTVAENMHTVGGDIAVAYRLQIGREQWLFYRSIAESSNRTFLGQNFADEFYIGKIGEDDEFESLLEIE